MCSVLYLANNSLKIEINFIFQTKLLVNAGTLYSSTMNSGNKEYATDGKPISRFSIPKIDTLPPDMQELMNESMEKVSKFCIKYTPLKIVLKRLCCVMHIWIPLKWTSLVLILTFV